MNKVFKNIRPEKMGVSDPFFEISDTFFLKEKKKILSKSSAL